MRATYAPTHTVRRNSSEGWVTSIVLFPACVYYLLNRETATILDTASRLMFDAGRYFFGFSEGLWVYAGGAILQILLPFALVAFFFLHRYAFGLQVFLFWLGQNLINVSTYFIISEAAHPNRLGVRDAEHLLAGLQISEYTVHIGAVLFAVGSTCFLICLLIPRLLSR